MTSSPPGLLQRVQLLLGLFVYLQTLVQEAHATFQAVVVLIWEAPVTDQEHQGLHGVREAEGLRKVLKKQIF